MPQLPFKPDPHGGIILEGVTVNGEAYDDFQIPPSPYQDTATVRDCAFVDCRTTVGTCVIQFGASLENVVFDNLDCGDAIHIDHSVTLTRLTVRGTKPKSLYLKPRNGSRTPTVDYPPDVTAIDLSEYHSDIEVLGLPRSAIVLNPERHVRINAAWKELAPEWYDAGIGRLGFFSICLKKVGLGDYEFGYFGLPTARSKYYDEAMSEMAILRDRFGLTFD